MPTLGRVRLPETPAGAILEETKWYHDKDFHCIYGSMSPVKITSKKILAAALQTQLLLALSVPVAFSAPQSAPDMVLKGAYTEAPEAAAAATEKDVTTEAVTSTEEAKSEVKTEAAPAASSTSSTSNASDASNISATSTASTSTAAAGSTAVDDKKLETGISVNKVIKLAGEPITSQKLKCVEFAPANDPFEEAINGAAIVAMERDAELVDADSKLFKMQGTQQNAKEISKNFIHYLLNYRGVGPSSAGANALMERNLSTSSVLAAELKWEKAVDEKYVSTVNACAELADAMDREDAQEREQAIADARANLEYLVGAAEAAKVVDKFQALRNVMPKVTPHAGNLGVAAERARIKTLEEAIIKQDPILSETAEKLNKYAVKKRTEVLTGAIQSALGVAGLAPSLIGPCAQLVKTAFILSTGGSEENKLYKEVFLFKRIEVRARTISQLSNTAVRSYHMACLTNRPFLAAYAQSLMSKMTDKDTVEKIVSGNIDTRVAAPALEIKVAEKLPAQTAPVEKTPVLEVTKEVENTKESEKTTPITTSATTASETTPAELTTVSGDSSENQSK